MNCGTPRHSIIQTRRQSDVNTVNQKLQFIKRILRLIEDDYKLILLLQRDDIEKTVDSEKTIMVHIYHEVIQHIMNMVNVPKNIHAMRVYMSPEDHVQHIELYSSSLPVSTDRLGFYVEWQDISERG